MVSSNSSKAIVSATHGKILNWCRSTQKTITQEYNVAFLDIKTYNGGQMNYNAFTNGQKIYNEFFLSLFESQTKLSHGGYARS